MVDYSKFTDQDLEIITSGGSVDGLSMQALEEITASSGRGAMESPMPKVGSLEDAPIVSQSGPRSSLGNLARLGAQGVTQGLGDELEAAAAAGTVGLTGFLGGNTGGLTMGQAYDQALQMSRGELDRARKQEGVTGLIAEGVGSVLPYAALSARLPQLTQGIGRYAARGLPQAAITAGGIGATQAGLYGFGEGEGSLGQRAAEAGKTAIIGGAAGGAGVGAMRGAQAVGRRLRRPIGALSQRAVRALGITPRAAEEVVTAPQTVSLAESLPTGARTGDVDIMRAEEAARQNLLGPERQTQIQNIDRAFIEDVQRRAQGLSPTGQTSEQLLEGSVEDVRKRGLAFKRLNRSLMDSRNAALARTQAYRDYTQKTLGRQVDELVATPDFEVALSKESNAPLLQDIDSLKKIIDDESVSFAKLQAWRSGLNDYKPGTQQGKLAGDLGKAYNDWLGGIAEEAIKEGDQDIVDKIFQANSKYADFKKKFGRNKFTGQTQLIKDILEKSELTADNLVNMAFGKKATGTNKTRQNIRSMIRAVGEGQQDALKENMKGGLVMRVLEEADGNVGKIKSGFEGLLSNRGFRDELATPEDINTINDIIFNVGKYQNSINRRDVYSPSAPLILRALGGMTKLGGRVLSPLGGNFLTGKTDEVLQYTAREPQRRLVDDIVREFGERAREEAGRTYYYGAIGGAAPAGISAQDGYQDVLRVNVPGEQQ